MRYNHQKREFHKKQTLNRAASGNGGSSVNAARKSPSVKVVSSEKYKAAKEAASNSLFRKESKIRNNRHTFRDPDSKVKIRKSYKIENHNIYKNIINNKENISFRLQKAQKLRTVKRRKELQNIPQEKPVINPIYRHGSLTGNAGSFKAFAAGKTLFKPLTNSIPQQQDPQPENKPMETFSAIGRKLISVPLATAHPPRRSAYKRLIADAKKYQRTGKVYTPIGRDKKIILARRKMLENMLHRKLSYLNSHESIYRFVNANRKLLRRKMLLSAARSVTSKGAVILLIIIVLVFVIVTVMMAPWIGPPTNNPMITMPGIVMEYSQCWDNSVRMKVNEYAKQMPDLDLNDIRYDHIVNPHTREVVAYWYVARQYEALEEAETNRCKYLEEDGVTTSAGNIYSKQEIDTLEYCNCIPEYVAKIAIPAYKNENGGNLPARTDEFWEQKDTRPKISDYYALFKIGYNLNTVLIVPEEEILPTGDSYVDPETGAVIDETKPKTTIKIYQDFIDPVEYAKQNDLPEEAIADLRVILAGNDQTFNDFWDALWKAKDVKQIDYPDLVIDRGLKFWTGMGCFASGNLTALQYYMDSNPDSVLAANISSTAEMHTSPSDVLSDQSTLADLINRGYPIGPGVSAAADPSARRINAYLYMAIGRGWSPSAWCNAFITYCFQNGEQGYFDIENAWTLDFGDISDIGPHSISDAGGIYASYEARIEMIKQVREQIEFYASSGSSSNKPEESSYLNTNDSSHINALLKQLCLKLGDPGLRDSGYTPVGSWRYIPDYFFSAQENSSYNYSEDFYNENFNSLLYALCSSEDAEGIQQNIDSDDDMIASGITNGDGKLDNKERIKVLEAMINDLDLCFGPVPADENLRWAETAEGMQLCNIYGREVFNYVSSGASLRSSFTWWTSDTYVSRDDDVAVAFQQYAYSKDLQEADVLRLYKELTGRDLNINEFETTQFDFEGYMQSTATHLVQPLNYPTNDNVYPLYLHTSNFHVAFIYNGSTYQREPYGNFPIRYIYEDAGRASLTAGDKSIIAANPWDPDNTIYVSRKNLDDYTESKTDPKQSKLFKWISIYNGDKNFIEMAEEFYDNASDEERSELGLTRPELSYDNVFAKYEHRTNKYIPYFDAWYCPRDREEGLYGSYNGLTDNNNSTIWDVIYYYGANSRDGITPWFDILCETDAVNYGIYPAGSTYCTYTADQLKNQCYNIDSFADGTNVLQKGDILIYHGPGRDNNGVENGHIRLVVDRFEYNGTYYVIILEGNSSHRCRLSCNSEFVLYNNVNGLLTVNNGNNPYQVFRIFDFN